jgi:hypothetical protein
MTQEAPAPVEPKSIASTNNRTKARLKGPAGPAQFEEAFWRRYSPHHELPLSSATSVALHVLALSALIVAGWFVANLLDKSKLEVDTLEMATLAGGGGSRQGEGIAAGDRPAVGGMENVDNSKEEQAKPSGSVPPNLVEKLPILDRLDVIFDENQNGRTIDQANEAVQRLSKLSKDARDKLFKAIGPGKGLGGPGKDGGKDIGKDKGDGPLTGPGKGRFHRRWERVLRWVMKFNTLNGNDYRRQLAGLDAVLAFPQPDGSYMVYRDLKQRPIKGKVEDISSIKQIFWVDEKMDSIHSLAQAMDVPVPDGPIVAFFPEKLEAELLRKELSYRNKKEEDIHSTTFQIRLIGGTFIPEVVEQY